jgi:predicted nicotinamide N-methyase
VVRGKRVLDLGAGGGIVSIAAALAGAREIIASEADPIGRVALALNLAANGVNASIVSDLTSEPPPVADLVAGGDVFYAPEVAERMLPFLDRCREAGIEVLVGDPGRKYLPRDELEPLAEYLVAEVGASRGALSVVASVHRYWGKGKNEAGRA